MAEKIHRNSLQPGYTLHWYKIEEILGQGGFGITYLASDTNLHTKVAIKEYLPIEMAVREGDHSVHPVTENHNKQFKWGLDRFLTEARTLAKYDHPNIVRVLAVFEANNTGYMVMTYEQGVSLAEKIRNRQTIEEQELIKLIIPLMGGLERMHDSGFIHRDVKPDNLFIRQDGSPVLLDFGSARQAMVGETRTLTSLVTPGYAPFEQYYSKSDEQGPWTDIYGLGATLYRAVTGIAPADAVDRSNALLKRSNDTYIPCAEFVGDRYSQRFLTAIDSALKFNVEDRPQSIKEWRVLFDLPEAPLSGAITDSIPTQPGTQLRTFATKGKKTTRRPTSTSSGAQQSVNGKMIGALMLVLLLAGGGYFFQAEINQQLNNWQTGQEVSELITVARQHMSAERYTEPPGNNALETFRNILLLQPDNAEAKLGLQTITGQMIKDVRSAVQANEFDQAEILIAKAKGINPSAAEIKLTVTELEQAKLAYEQHLSEEAERKKFLDETVNDAINLADDGKVTETLALIEKARTLQATDEDIIGIKNHLYMALESSAAIAAHSAKQHVSNNDTGAARQALAQARQIKTRLDSLNLTQPDMNKEQQIHQALNTARMAATQGLLEFSMESLDTARDLGASTEQVERVKQQLRSDLEAEVVQHTEAVKQAMQNNDTEGARRSLQKAKDTKAKLDSLD